MDRATRQARALIASIAQESAQSSVRIVCPFCGGGRSQEHSLVITIRDDGVFYCCHRASCPNGRGTIGGSTNRGLVAGLPPNPHLRALDREYRSLEYGSYWANRYEQATFWPFDRAKEHGLFRDAEEPNIAVWECRNLWGELLGHQTRVDSVLNGKKIVRTFKQKEGPFYNYIPAENYSSILVIVEDSLSAACVAARGANGLALIGTHCSKELAAEIAKWSKGHYPEARADFRICLDPGAEIAAFKVQQTLQLYGLNPIVKLLDSDIKDMPVHKQTAVIYFHDMPSRTGTEET